MRKGFDIFCDVGKHIIDEGYDDFIMYWIGSDEGKDLNPYNEIAKRGLENHVKFLGTKNCPSDYFEFGDIFLMTSREDPHPLVCMEAAECNMPVICFDKNAGATHTFVENDAGIVIPYLRSDLMSNAVLDLLNDDKKREELGFCAHEKVIRRHYVDVVAPVILNFLPTIKKSNVVTEFESYKNAIDKYKIISFDIFDTLITRRLDHPDVVFDLIEYEHTENEAGILNLFNERMRTAG